MRHELVDRTQFRFALQAELVERIRNNSRYSLRSFARALNIDASLLSKILRGQRPVSKDLYSELVDKLGLSPTQLKQFRKQQEPDSAQFRLLSDDEFEVISNWIYYPILELSRVRGFQKTPRWIATRLGISTTEASAAIERLQRVGLLKVTPSGRWIVSDEMPTTIGKTATSGALRQMQKQILEKAIQALDNEPITSRDQTTMTMAIDTKLLPEAREKIKRFRREMRRLLQQNRPCDRVYNLSISLYPVSKPKRSSK